MSKTTVTHEIKLPITLTVILGVIAFGLVANVFKPLLRVNHAFASGEVHKIALCTQDGAYCAGVTKGRNGHLMVVN